MSKTVLVTGGAGYIGSIAVEFLIKENYKVIVLDDLSTGHKESIFEEAVFYNAKVGDTKTLEKIFSTHEISCILHIAGAALVEESTKNPYKYFDINLCQPINMLETMLKFNVKNIVFSSTCAVYGIPESNAPIKEDSTTKPISPYGESKLVFEKALEWYKKSHGLNYIALRYFNVAGASENRGENHNPETHLSYLIVKSIKSKKNDLKIFGNDYPTKDGTAVRDYIHVIDLTYAHIKAIETLISNKKHNNIYNLGYGHGYSVLEIVNAVKEVFNLDIPFTYCERRPGDPPILIADATKIQSDLNWRPTHDNIQEIIRSANKFIITN